MPALFNSEFNVQRSALAVSDDLEVLGCVVVSSEQIACKSMGTPNDKLSSLSLLSSTLID